MAAFRLSTGPGQEIVIAPSAWRAICSGTPLPSLPMRRAAGPAMSTRSAGCAARAVVEKIFTPASRRRWRHSFSPAASSGTRKTLPAEARTAFGFHALTVPGRLTTPVAPKASAERRIVPRLPGSCRPASTTTSGAVSCGPPSKCAHVQSGGSTSAAIGCGVSVASAESSSFLGRRRISVSRRQMQRVEQFLCALRHKNSRNAQARAQRLFQHIRPFDSHQPRAPLPGAASARRSSFRRAFCLLSTTRTGMEPTLGLL